jgi:sensor histidine kinase regulating citrate/malate metabolism
MVSSATRFEPLAAALQHFDEFMTIRELEQQLLEDRLRLAAILQTSTDAIVVIDDRGVIQSFNGAAERMFRCSEHDVLGTDLERFVPERSLGRTEPVSSGSVLHPDERVDAAMEGGLATVGEFLQEALQNAVKHSGSHRVDVSLQRSAIDVALTVRDSGIGFQLDEVLKGRRGLRLVSMKERLKLVVGELTIDSRPQYGTTIRACVPLTAASPSGVPHASITSLT